MAAAPGSMFLGFTVSIVTAGQRVAGINTGSRRCTGQVARTVIVRPAADILCANTGANKGVADCSWRTFTLEGSNLIDTDGILTARVPTALIDVNTASGTSIGEAGQAHTLRRV